MIDAVLKDPNLVPEKEDTGDKERLTNARFTITENKKPNRKRKKSNDHVDSAQKQRKRRKPNHSDVVSPNNFERNDHEKSPSRNN